MFFVDVSMLAAFGVAPCHRHHVSSSTIRCVSMRAKAIQCRLCMMQMLFILTTLCFAKWLERNEHTVPPKVLEQGQFLYLCCTLKTIKRWIWDRRSEFQLLFIYIWIGSTTWIAPVDWTREQQYSSMCPDTLIIGTINRLKVYSLVQLWVFPVQTSFIVRKV